MTACLSFVVVYDRKIDHKACASAIALRFDSAAVCSHYPITDGETEAASPAGRLGCEERVEDVLRGFFVQSGSGVADPDDYLTGVRPRGDGGVPPSGIASRAFRKIFRNTCCI